MAQQKIKDTNRFSGAWDALKLNCNGPMIGGAGVVATLLSRVIPDNPLIFADSILHSPAYKPRGACTASNLHTVARKDCYLYLLTHILIIREPVWMVGTRIRRSRIDTYRSLQIVYREARAVHVEYRFVERDRVCLFFYTYPLLTHAEIYGTTCDPFFRASIGLDIVYAARQECRYTIIINKFR